MANIVRINLDYTGFFAELAADGVTGLSRRFKNETLVVANRATVKHWHRRIIPRHFEASARWRYHYKKRKLVTRRIKETMARGETVRFKGEEVPDEQIQKGGKVDLVRGGQVEGKAKRFAPIRSTSGKATVVVATERFVKRRKTAGRPDLEAEIVSRTKREDKRLTEIWGRTFMAGARTFNSQIRLRKTFVGR